MMLVRRIFLTLATCAAVLSARSCMADAQTYPTGPVRIVVGVAAGGAQDAVSRLVGEWLSVRLGVPVMIDNRPGAGGNTATEAVVRAPADGYTLLSVATASAINATLYEKLTFNFMRDIAPIAIIIHQPQVMVVNPSVPSKTVPEFIAYAKNNPRKVNMASAGNGTGPHVTGELFNMMAGLEIAHVPYRGVGPATIDLISGQVQVMFISPLVVLEHVKTGKLRAIAVTTSNRSGSFPNIPTVSEFLPGYESSTWFGLGAPKATPAEIIDKLNKEINAGLVDAKLRARLDALGGGVVTSSAADFARLIAAETEKWGNVVRAAKIKLQ